MNNIKILINQNNVYTTLLYIKPQTLAASNLILKIYLSFLIINTLKKKAIKTFSQYDCDLINPLDVTLFWKSSSYNYPLYKWVYAFPEKIWDIVFYVQISHNPISSSEHSIHIPVLSWKPTIYEIYQAL